MCSNRGAATEIERKFLLASADVTDEASAVGIRQGYISVEADPEVRLRVSGNEKFVLTVKSSLGLAREETEIELTAGQFRDLWPITAGRRLEKERYRVPLHPGLVAEVDVYLGDLQGLKTVEVEFPSLAEARSFDPPAWFGVEVTGDRRFSNRVLAMEGLPA